MSGPPGLRGFAQLRTQSVKPLPVIVHERPRCTKCGAVLREGNDSGRCAAHRERQVEIPDWAIAMCEYADWGQINAMATVLCGGPAVKWQGADREAREERDRAIRRDYVAGLSMDQCMAKHRCAKRTVQEALEFVPKRKRGAHND